MFELVMEKSEELKNVWLQAWCAVARAENCYDSESATRWADEAVKAYKERFAPLYENLDN